MEKNNNHHKKNKRSNHKENYENYFSKESQK